MHGHFNYYSLVILGGFATILLGLGIATIKYRLWVRHNHPPRQSRG